MRIATLTVNPAVDKHIFVDTYKPGMLNRASTVEMYPSGKGVNVSLALLQLGVKSTAVGFVAGSAGQFIEQHLAQLGLRTHFMRTAGETRTNIKLTELSSGQVTEINEPGPSVGDRDIAMLLATVLKVGAETDVFVLSGSLCRGVSTGFYRDLTAKLKANGCKIVLDTYGDPLRLALDSGPYLVKPNRLEAEELLGRKLSSKDDMEKGACEIMDIGADHVVLSDGENGALFASRKELFWAGCSAPVSVQSPIGCGDALVAGIIAGMYFGYPWRGIVRLAIACATGTAACRGTSFPSRGDVDRLLKVVQVEEM